MHIKHIQLLSPNNLYPHTIISSDNYFPCAIIVMFGLKFFKVSIMNV